MHDMRRVSGSRLLAAAVIGILTLESARFGASASETQTAGNGALDAAMIDRHLDALRKAPQDPATLAFFREMPFDRLWPEVRKADSDLQLRYLLLLRFLNDRSQEAVAELMRRKGDDVLRVAQETYWPLVVFPLREDGAYHWATLASQWDPRSRTLTNIIRLSIEKRYHQSVDAALVLTGKIDTLLKSANQQYEAVFPDYSYGTYVKRIANAHSGPIGICILNTCIPIAILILMLRERKRRSQQSAAPLPQAPQTGPSEGAR